MSVRKRPFVPFIWIAVALVTTLVASAMPVSAGVLNGMVKSGSKGLPDYLVILVATGSKNDVPLPPEVLGFGLSKRDGAFTLPYTMPTIPNARVVATAQSGPVVLAAALGNPDYLPDSIVINERTTVATGVAFAQFIGEALIGGNRFGVSNAVRMAGNLASVRSGKLARVLDTPPNGPDTTTRATFNSLANMVALCTRDPSRCDEFLKAATPRGGQRPKNTLAAIASITKHPASKVGLLLNVSKQMPIYSPALSLRPASWGLFLRFTGTDTSKQTGDDLVNGPGNFAIDRRGNIWVNDNFVPRPPEVLACAGRRLLKYLPWGEPAPGTPYFGGGLEGSAFGIALDVDGNVWVANFGFEGRGCEKLPVAASHDSISKFRPDGTPIDHSGFKNKEIFDWPSMILPDPSGNVWVNNCLSDTVAFLPNGDPDLARLIDLPKPSGQAQIKPFSIAIGKKGEPWITGNLGDTLTILRPDGLGVRQVITSNLNRPMGIAADSKGNMWVSNSAVVDVPCPPTGLNIANGDSSVSLFSSDGDAVEVFKGGGLTVPWGIAVDGADTVWVANFGGAKAVGRQIGRYSKPRVSRFCGTSPEKCPPGFRTVGAAISPDNGYVTDSLVRVTGIAIDPSGNVWLANNYKLVPPRFNPGGNSIAVMIGAAVPLKTPLIGLPQHFPAFDPERFQSASASAGGTAVPAPTSPQELDDAGLVPTGPEINVFRPRQTDVPLVEPRLVEPTVVEVQQVEPTVVEIQQVEPKTVEIPLIVPETVVPNVVGDD